MRRHTLLIAGALLVSAMAAQAQQRPAGMVEDLKAAPQAGIDVMDYVFPGQRIALGKDGQLSLSYFSSCKIETIKGGTVTIGQAESRVEGGTLRGDKRPCDPKKFGVTTQLAEAGAGITRLGKGSAGDDEVTLRSDRPIFQWQDSGGNVRVFAMDSPKPQLVWSGSAQKSWIEYPTGAPKLQPAVPYTVEVATATGKKARANFSIDPDLQLADTRMNRTVPVRR